MEKLKSHQSRPQNYRHNYLLVLLTGLLGCKWHRYKQSMRTNRKRDLFGFAITFISFVFVCFTLYTWKVLNNDYYSIEIRHTLEWPISFYILGLALLCTFVVYHCILFILCLFHIHLGFQLYIHPLLQAISFVILAGCATVVILLSIYHPLWWSLVAISLKVVGPFLDIGAIVFFTLVGFVLIKQWFLTSWKKGKWISLAVMTCLMLCLYLAPLVIRSPLVSDTTPPTPGVVAYGGACYHAPQNTEFAFKKALGYRVKGILTHVQFSLDSIPFVFEDDSLSHLTDAESVFPEFRSYNPTTFSMKNLKLLNVGSWFINNDPFNTVDEIPRAEILNVSFSRILTLTELLDMLSENSVAVDLYVLETFSEQDAVKRMQKYKIIDDIIAKSNYNSSKIYWQRAKDGTGPQNTMALQTGDDLGQVEKAQAVFLKYDQADRDTIRKYTEQNVTVIVGPINTNWMMSYFQFLGVDFAAARNVAAMVGYNEEVWSMSERRYMALWISLDIVSILMFIVFYIFHRIRIFGTNFSPESISLNTGRTLQYRSRTMKEKLLREGAAIDTLEDTEMQDRGMENQQPAYSVASFRNVDISPDSGMVSPHLISKSSNAVFSI